MAGCDHPLATHNYLYYAYLPNKFFPKHVRRVFFSTGKTSSLPQVLVCGKVCVADFLIRNEISLKSPIVIVP